MSIISKFCEEFVDTKLNIQMDKPELDDVGAAVEEMVKLVLDGVSTIDPRYKVTNILKVGSFYEGTKLCSPDEFDFLVELGEISKDIDTSPEYVITGCTQGAIHLRMNKTFLDKYGFTSNRSNVFLSSSHIYSRFKNHIFNAILKQKSLILRKNTGTLKLKGQCEGSGPNVEFKVEWWPKTNASPSGAIGISIDVTFYLSLSADTLDKVLNTSSIDLAPATSLIQRQCTTEVLYTRSPIDGAKCIIVPPSMTNVASCQVYSKNVITDTGRTSICFYVAFTPLEVEVMQSLHSNHILSYKVLKFVCSFHLRKVKSLSSYVLKTAVAHHSYVCDDSRDIFTCLEQILAFLISCAEKSHLPHMFIPTKNVWVTDRHSGDRILPIDIIKTIRSVIRNIAQTEEESYEFPSMLKNFRFRMSKIYEDEDKLIENIQKQYNIRQRKKLDEFAEVGQLQLCDIVDRQKLY